LAGNCPTKGVAFGIVITSPAIPPAINPTKDMSKKQMTTQAAARIQAATAKSQGQVTKGSFAAVAQAAAAKNAAPAKPGK